MWKFVRWVLIFHVSLFFIILFLPLLGPACEENSTSGKFDVIIVLGNPATLSCKPSGIMKKRVNAGIELFRRGLAKKILFTGSSVLNHCSESEVMYDYARAKGVPDSCIIREGRARNTYQNAYYAVEEMKSLHFNSAAIVTSQFHLNRACRIFANYDINYRMFPCNDPEGTSAWKSFIFEFREKIIQSYHFVFGYSRRFGLEPD